MKQQTQLNVKNYKSKEGFVYRYQKLVKDTVIPYQYAVLNDAVEGVEKSHVIANFENAAKAVRGEDVGDGFYGMVFQDSDAGKWIEAAAYSLVLFQDEKLEQEVDELIDKIEAAQDTDGYLNTYYTIKDKEKRWTNLLEGHELYCSGHMMEAAVAYYEATGKDKLLKVMQKNAAHIYDHFITEGHEGYPGHPEVELALLRMYQATGDKVCLDLAKHFIDVRGVDNKFYEKELAKRNWQVWGNDAKNADYQQSGKPVREQSDATGHSVRAVYLYTGMADLAAVTEDEELKEACRRLWESITQRRMYVTGGIGSTVEGEAFSVDYDLPNETAYAETCASIGLMFFASRMLEMEADSKYADVMERAFYNTVLAGMQLDGKRFFYVNPLEVDPEESLKNPDKSHVKATRPSWFGCACCPPNLARTIPAIHRYIYDELQEENRLWVNQWIDSSGEFENVRITQQHDFKNKKESTFTITNKNNAETEIFIRIPYWLDAVKVWVNGEEKALEIVDGYFKMIPFFDSVEVRMTYELPVLKWQANPNVKSAYGKVAFQKGPFIYAAEESDNESALHLYHVTGEATSTEIEDAVLGAISVIDVPAQKFEEREPSDLYHLYQKPVYSEKNLRLIPYYCWANRETGEMRVWLNSADE